MTIVRGIDTDNYDGPVSVERFRKLYDDYGVRFNIIGLEAGMPFVDIQKANSLSAGLQVPLSYKFLYWAPNDLERMKDACRAQLPVSIDVEYGNGLGSFAATVNRIWQAKQVLLTEGLYWGIYSSPSEWLRLTGQDMTFAGDRGWSARYPYLTIPPVGYMPDFANFPTFGGTTHEAWQYADHCYGEPTFDMNAMEVEEVPEAKDGWIKEGNTWALYNNDVKVQIIGDDAGSFPGRIRKLFGDQYFYLRHTDDGNAVWSAEPGD